MNSEPSAKPAPLEPSPLGTKEYWDTLYTTEISNHAADPSDVGTIWFDDSAAEDKILSYLHSPALSLSPSTSFLDLGTGNGHFLFRLREKLDDNHPDAEEEQEQEEEEEGVESSAGPEANKSLAFTGRILGTDYSLASITFAQRLAASKNHGLGSASEIEFLHFDIMGSAAEVVLTGANEVGWDMVLDKGTFDAVSLCGEVDGHGRSVCEGYKERVVPLVREGGLFLVTSCNWTEEELRSWFEGGQLAYEGTIGYRSFSFGGKKGQTISSVCFRKN